MRTGTPSLDDQAWMGVAIQKAMEGVALGQTPFGACVVKEGTVVSCAHNHVWSSGDITAHAEVQAIREACARLQTVNLAGSTVYSTCEPCPMCFTACHWARISTIVFGARIEDAQRLGFHELSISTRVMKELGRSEVELWGDCRREANLELFAAWLKRTDRRTY